MTDLSFVIPCYKSENTVLQVLEEIGTVMEERPDLSYEVVTVVDGSPDNVFTTLRDASASRPHLKVIDLSKNYGQINAQMAGFRNASGEIIISVDDDGQCPLDQTWRLLDPIFSKKADFVAAKYETREQNPFRNFGSHMNQAMAQSLVGMPDNFEISNFYAFTKMVNEELANYPNPHPYFLGCIFNVTSRAINVPMKERERISGVSNYTIKKLLSIWLSGFTGYSIKPLRIADFVGILCAIFGFVFGIVTIVAKLTMDVAIGYSSILASILFIGGVIMVLLGLIGEYVGRMMLLLNRTPQYVIRQIAQNGMIAIPDPKESRGPTIPK